MTSTVPSKKMPFSGSHLYAKSLDEQQGRMDKKRANLSHFNLPLAQWVVISSMPCNEHVSPSGRWNKKRTHQVHVQTQLLKPPINEGWTCLGTRKCTEVDIYIPRLLKSSLRLPCAAPFPTTRTTNLRWIASRVIAALCHQWLANQEGAVCM